MEPYMKKYHVILQRHNRRNYVGEVIKEIDIYARTNNEARYKAIEELGDLYQYYSDSGHPMHQLVIRKEN